MKKLWMTGISLVLIAMLAMTAFAADVSFTMAPEKTEVLPGDTIMLTASCTAGTEATSYGLMLKFDEDVFEIVSGDVTVEGTLIESFGTGTANGFVFMFDGAVAYSGQVGTANIKVKESAPAGTYTIAGTASVKNGAQVVESDSCSVTVTVSEKTATQESTAVNVPGDMDEVLESATLPDITKPAVGAVPEETIPEKSEESTLTTGAESTITTGTEKEGIPSWVFPVVVAVIVVLGIAAFVISKKKK